MDILELDAAYWDERYKNRQTGWDIGYASPPIINYAEASIPKHASILIPGCGNAHEAKALLALGFKHITLLDIAPTLVENVRQELGEHAPIQVICQDFFQHNQQYDYILEQTFFCALHPTLRQKYVQQMAALLHPNGILAGLLFNKEFTQQGPPFGGNKTIYQQLFHSDFNILQMIDCPNSIPPRQGNELFFALKKK
ncbi:methyltransferase domain-containing protein [Sphingobacterium sp. N143]|mgnify:CR=1 FL=1|uniref:methyltransferase n=1 Tax=Sphingobacterium sp. N143 TaxID=2746727 RepID=UPI0025762406|nr:methyltransferase [Sphingobacterium sp. N143]MDM1294014.1 methyltransferase domain-containing protein [Sphingobacterium sp. N143]